MPHGEHSTRQTAFRLPEGLLAWLREQAEREDGDVTMTAITVRALERERERCAGITTSATAAGAVSPPPTPAPVVAAEDEQPQQAAKNCKHRNMRMAKGICPDCNEWTVRS